jgi:hypothetical protein
MSAAPPDPRPQTERITEYFSGGQAEERYLNLLHYTERQLRSMFWCISTADDSIPGGLQARDMLNETVKSLFLEPGAEGFRALPAHVPVEAALKMVVWSKVSHAAEKSENIHRAEPVGVNREGEEVDRLETDAPMWEPSHAKLSPQQLAHLAARCAGFVEFCRTDKTVYDMLVIVRDRGIDGPADRLARELGIRLAEVYTARKRLGTLLRQYRKAATK